MTAALEPMVDEPALVVEDTIRVLVVADIHLGIEWDLANSGIIVPSQSGQGLARMIEYLDIAAPERVVLLGDVKHNVPRISWQEREEVPHPVAYLDPSHSILPLPLCHISRND